MASICSTHPMTSDFQQVTSVGSKGILKDVHPSVTPLCISRKPFKIVRKPISVTQLVLVVECEPNKGSSPNHNTFEAAGLTMPLSVP